MSRPPTIRADGSPDRRGQSEGSRSTQFAPGDDRRRPGRPRGSKSLKHIYLAAGDMPIVLDQGNGKKRRITTKEGVILKQREKALKGDQRSAERFLDKIAEHSPPDVDLNRTEVLLEEDAVLLRAARLRGLLSDEEGHDDDDLC